MIRVGSTPLWKPGVGAQLDRSHPAAQGLLACWLFNENGGNTLYDLAGNYHFILTGGGSRTASPSGPAIKFDGTSGQGIAAGHPLAGMTAFTVLLRVRQKDGIASPYGPYLGSDQKHDTGVYIGMNSTSTMQFFLGGTNILIPVTNDAWGDYACVWDRSRSLKLGYANAVQVASALPPFITIPNYLQTLIGKGSAFDPYCTDSQLGWMKVYNRALSAAEIAADGESPWAMFLPAAARRFFSLPVSGGSGASTVGGLSIGAGRLNIGV